MRFVQHSDYDNVLLPEGSPDNFTRQGWLLLLPLFNPANVLYVGHAESDSISVLARTVESLTVFDPSHSTDSLIANHAPIIPSVQFRGNDSVLEKVYNLILIDELFVAISDFARQSLKSLLAQIMASGATLPTVACVARKVMSVSNVKAAARFRPNEFMHAFSHRKTELVLRKLGFRLTSEHYLLANENYIEEVIPSGGYLPVRNSFLLSEKVKSRIYGRRLAPLFSPVALRTFQHQEHGTNQTSVIETILSAANEPPLAGKQLSIAKWMLLSGKSIVLLGEAGHPKNIEIRMSI